MFKYLPLLWANLRRKRLRTSLTLASIVIAFLLFGMLRALQTALTGSADLAGADRLITMHKMGFMLSLPQSYLNRVRGMDGVQQNVAATREARPLPVPQAEHALVAGPRIERHLLRAPHAHRRELLVLPGLEVDVVAREQVVRLPQRLVHVVERRALVAGHEAGRIQARGGVAHPLHDQEPRERLQAGQVDAAALERVLVVQRDVGELHGH